MHLPGSWRSGAERGQELAISMARRYASLTRIHAISVADLVFLLIVFFVLTFQVTPDRVDVDLPKTVCRTVVPPDAALISIAPPAEGEVIRVSNGTETSMLVHSEEEMLSIINLVVAADPDRYFVIKADREVRYARVDTVIDALKRSHVKVIFLLSDQRTVYD